LYSTSFVSVYNLFQRCCQSALVMQPTADEQRDALLSLLI
jgi:hypothetical protein